MVYLVVTSSVVSEHELKNNSTDTRSKTAVILPDLKIFFINSNDCKIYSDFQRPCKLQNSRALTSVAFVIKTATGFSPGWRYLRMMTPSLVKSSIHSIK